MCIHRSINQPEIYDPLKKSAASDQVIGRRKQCWICKQKNRVKAPICQLATLLMLLKSLFKHEFPYIEYKDITYILNEDGIRFIIEKVCI